LGNVERGTKEIHSESDRKAGGSEAMNCIYSCRKGSLKLEPGLGGTLRS
jgi:hypothetical protein